MDISIFGLGYVGSVTAACLAELGHTVVGTDIQIDKVEAIRQGKAPVQEPGLADLIRRHVDAGRLHATTDVHEVLARTTCSFIAVGTPSHPDGTADLRSLENCVESIAFSLARRPHHRPHTLVVRSTVPPGTTARLLQLTADLTGLERGVSLLGGVNPEFLREGTAVDDFFHTPILVLGTDDPASRAVMQQAYAGTHARPVLLPSHAAEFLKYTSNAFHALKIAFANEIDRVARAFEIDGTEVMQVLCQDNKLNISAEYLRPGFAYGGSCLPKDLEAINHLARQQQVEVPLLAAIGASNGKQIDAIFTDVVRRRPRHVGILGVTFKASTDDVRDSAALYLAQRLLAGGVEVSFFDVQLHHRRVTGDNRRFLERTVPDWSSRMAGSMHRLYATCDVLVVTHPEERHLAFIEQRRAQPGPHPLILDYTGRLASPPAAQPEQAEPDLEVPLPEEVRSSEDTSG